MNDQAIRATAAPSTLIVFECFAVPIFLLFLYGAVMNQGGWDGAAIVGVLGVLIFVWWEAFLLEIGNDELIYRSLLVRKKIKLSDIRRAVRKIDLMSRGDRPPNRLEVHAVVDGRDIDFDINMKPFRWEDVKK